MTEYIELNIKKLDTGFLLTTEDQQHAITSPDNMVSKAMELLDISKPHIKTPIKLKDRGVEPTPATNKPDKQNAPDGLSTNNVCDPKPLKTTDEPDTSKVDNPKAKEGIPSASNNQKYGILEPAFEGIGWPIKQSEFIVPELIKTPLNENVRYAEAEDGRILVEYKQGRNIGRVYSTWEEIDTMLFKTKPGSELLVVKAGDFTGSQRTAIRQFMIGVRAGLKKGDSVEIDPDKDFRPMLNRSSVVEGERGTLESVGGD